MVYSSSSSFFTEKGVEHTQPASRNVSELACQNIYICIRKRLGSRGNTNFQYQTDHREITQQIL